MDPEHTGSTATRKPPARGKRVFLRYARKRFGALRIAWSADAHFRSLTARGIRHSKARDQVLMLLAEQSSACERDGDSADRGRRKSDVRSACKLQQDRIRELDRIMLAELLPADRQPSPRFAGIVKAIAIAAVVGFMTVAIASHPRVEPPTHGSER
jgi:hypothetical protein